MRQWCNPSRTDKRRRSHEEGNCCLPGAVRNPGGPLSSFLLIMAVLYNDQDKVVNFDSYEDEPMKSILRLAIFLFIVFQLLKYDFQASQAANLGSNGFQTLLTSASAVKCDHTIGPNISTADNRSNFKAVRPGDTVCITAGYRNTLTLQNFEGKPETPIIFTNYGGQVVFNQTSDFAFRIQNSRYFRLTGTGVPNITYGIKVAGVYYTAGLNINFKSSNFEVDHIEVTNTSAAGITTKTNGVCSDGSGNNYDYDGDGHLTGDLDDVVNRDTFVQYDSVFHHNYLHNIGTEGFYIGGTSYSQGKMLQCAGGIETVFEPRLEGVQVYSNIVENTGWDGIQVSSAARDCTIAHNRIHQDSVGIQLFQRSSIGAGRGSVCNISNNFVRESGSKAIRSYVYGNIQIHNNVFVETGAKDNAQGDGIWILKDAGVSGKRVDIVYNTIVNPSAYGIRFGFPKNSDTRIQNNIIINPGR